MSNVIQPLLRPILQPLLRSPLEAGAGWSPRALFAAGEQGAWHDPSDLSTLYQDAAGTTPVTAVEQPVGLMLDKRLGLVRGAELVTNGTFDTADGWTADNATFSVADGVATVTNTGGAEGLIRQPITAVAGKTYELVGELTGSTRVIAFTFGGVRHGTFPSGPGIKRCVITATATGDLVIGTGNTEVGTYLSITSMSVRELPGHHASQSTAAARPVLRQTASGHRYADFDTVDDALVTTFPASLGSAGTVARSLPGTGAQILTAQTVGTTFTDTTDSHALVIVDRALTASETTLLTGWLNGRAGL